MPRSLIHALQWYLIVKWCLKTAETATSANESEEDEFYYDEEDYDADEFLSDGEEVEED